MNDNVQKISALTGALLLILASLFYASHFNGKIESLRPPENGISDYTPPGPQKIPGRLWQDPFEAFNSLTNRLPTDAALHSSLIPSNLSLSLSLKADAYTNHFTLNVPTNSLVKSNPKCHEFLNSLTNNSGTNVHVHVFGVMLEGTPYPEDVEIRKRLRYSVETALLTSELAPVDRMHIGVAPVQLHKMYDVDGQTNLQLAFEWFSYNKNEEDKFLVLWLREDDFGVQPLWTLGNLVNTLAASLATNSIDFTLIGPRASDTLRALASNEGPKFFTTNTCGESNHDASTALWSKVKIFSPESTAPENLLWPTNTIPPGSLGERPLTAFKIKEKCGLKEFKSWIATDDQLCRDLVTEIANRANGQALATNNVIVLISEGDTRFGRSLPLAFKDALANKLTNPRQSMPTLWNFRYLRGLDGIKPIVKGQEQKPAPPTSTEAMLVTALESTDEKAEGEAQTDYAERLADYLDRKNTELQRTNSAILAVGLLGSDVYDKMLLLQALRPRLKEALFFTTDLDARMWMPTKQLRSTRNLLVASSYPLDSGKEADPKQPTPLPFRDVYQAAVYSATCGAVATALSSGGLDEKSAKPRNLLGQIYEIGSNGPVLEPAPSANLSQFRRWAVNVPPFFCFCLLVAATMILIGWGNTFDALQALIKRIRKEHWIIGVAIAALIYVGIRKHPFETKMFAAALIMTLGMPFLATILLGGYRSKSLVVDNFSLPVLQGADDVLPCNPHLADRRPPLSSLMDTLGLVMFLTVAIGCAWWIGNKPGEESTELLAGISIWPTEGLRALVVALCIAFLLTARRRHKNHCRALWWDYIRECHLNQTIETIRSSQKAEKGWNRVRSILTNEWKAPTAQDGKIDARMLLAGYFKRGLTRNRYTRTLPLSAAYLVLAFGFVLLTNGMPVRLCVRGDYSWWFDNIMLSLSITGFLVVLFYSLDAARLAGKLLDGLGCGQTLWPEQLTNEWSLKRGLRTEDLDGLLDVRFAVSKTKETRILMSAPFVIFFLLLISRDRAFDDWQWTKGLIAVFAINFMLAALCWRIVRHSAKKVRVEALKKLDETIKYFEGYPDPEVKFKCKSSSGLGAKHLFVFTKKEYVRRLNNLYYEIDNERRGAFSLWIQDPTYLALFIPTGIMGIISFFMQYWLTRP